MIDLNVPAHHHANGNSTGIACGLCPEGYAFTSAGCEFCPPSGDPGLVALQVAVYFGNRFAENTIVPSLCLVSLKILTHEHTLMITLVHTNRQSAVPCSSSATFSFPGLSLMPAPSV